MNKIMLNSTIKTLQELILDVSSIKDKGITIINQEKDDFLPFSKIVNDANKFASYLRKLGMKPDDELIICTTDIKEFVITFWGCILSGVIAVPVSYNINDEVSTRIKNIWGKLNNPRIVTTKKLIQYITSTSDEKISSKISEGYIPSEEYINVEIDNIKYEAKPDKIAFVQFSSGSTGSPKGVILTHKGLIANVKAIINGLGDVVEDGLSSLSWLPLTHDMGLIGFHLAPLYCRVTHVLMDSMVFMKNPNVWLEKVCEYKSSVINSPNFGYNYLLKVFNKDSNIDLSHVRVIFNGAEPISYDLCQKFLKVMSIKKLNKNVIFPVYGMAEASLAVTFPEVKKEIEVVNVDRNYLSIGDQIKVLDNTLMNSAVTFVKLGQAIGNCEYRLTNNRNEILEEGSVGNIEITGDNVTTGYYNDAEVSKDFYTKDGWYKTGDIGFTYNGSLIVVGREKEICIINGINYYPNDIENIVSKCIKSDPSRIIAVSTLNYSKNTDYLLIFVLFDKGLSDFCKISKEINKLIKISFGCDVVVLPITEIPKTISGKVRRIELKRQYENGNFKEIEDKLNNLISETSKNDEDSNSLTEVEVMLVNIFKNEFQGLDISIDDDFTQYGISSLHLSNILNEIKKSFPESNFDISLLYRYKTIKEISNYINSSKECNKCEHINDIDMILKDL